MDKNEIIRLIHSEISNNQSRSRFQLMNIPKHEHTGGDSPQVAFRNLKDVPNAYYIEGVSAAGYTVKVNPTATGLEFVSSNSTFGGYTTANDASSYILPTGWSVTKSSTGHYTVTHNLDTTNYSVALTLINSGSAIYVVLTNLNANQFFIITRDGSNNSQDNEFSFVLTLIS